MKSFSKLYSDFWINYDHSEVLGTGVDGQLMALYLQSNTHHNMLGAYYLPLLYISSDLKLSVRQVQVALKKLCKINYCKYDNKTQYVWVCNLISEQIGDEVDIKDNRSKAIQEIWKSLPLKLEFLEEIYNRYHAAFHLDARDFKNLPKVCNIKREEVVINAAVDINTSIQLSTECLPLFVPPFEGASKPLESLSEEKSTDILKENSSEAPLKGPCISFEAVSDTSDATVIMQDPSDNTSNEVNNIALTPSKGLLSPSKGTSDPLQSPFEGPLEPLRSNIEDRSKNIEEINKKEEIEEELEKEERKKRDINNTQVLNSNIVAQAQLGTDEKQLNNFSFFEKPKKIEKSEAENTKEPEKAKELGKELCVQSSSNFPVILANFNSEPRLKPKIINSKNIVYGSVVAVFEHWKLVMQYPKSHLDEKREALIRQALQWGYSVEELCRAVTGCSLTSHNTGVNKQGERYVGLHVILRDADQIDRFIHNCHSPLIPLTEAGERLLSNSHVTNKWVNQKRDELAETVRNNNA